METITVDAASPESPYEQVRRQIAAQAAVGTLPPGHRLPTVRQLAADLGLAANTVARAYRELEADGVVETHGRHGTLVAASQEADASTDATATAFVAAARRQGLSRDEAIRLVERHWG